MRWPWSKSRRVALDHELAKAEHAQRISHEVVAAAREAKGELQEQAAKNHFGDMLQEAMARRARRYGQ